MKSLNVKSISRAIIGGALILGSTYTAVEWYKIASTPTPIDGAWNVCFTPNRLCQQQIVDIISQAQSTIAVQAYSFTDPDIVSALITAKNRKVKIEILLDHSNRNDPKKLLVKLQEQGIPIKIDHPQGIAHNKVIIIDEKTVITGSYNFSISAYKRNTENVLVIHDKNLAAKYLHNWRQRWAISREF